MAKLLNVLTLTMVLIASSASAEDQNGVTAYDSKCASASPGDQRAARLNARSFKRSSWTFYNGRASKPEGPGWEMYLPLIKRTIDTHCSPETAGFARALRDWQSLNQRIGGRPLVVDGIMGVNSANSMKASWHLNRFHVRRKSKGLACRIVPRTNLVLIEPEEAYNGVRRYLDPRALQAFRQMVARAKLEIPELMESNLLQIASGWRPRPASQRQGDGTALARDCSSHWSGMTVDINVGHSTGSPTDSTYSNRLYQSRQEIYHWLLDNAGEFGFVNYTFEPWHWEWHPEQVVDKSGGVERVAVSKGS